MDYDNLSGGGGGGGGGVVWRGREEEVETVSLTVKIEVQIME